MRRAWAAIVAVWATLAIVAGLAWTRPAPVQQDAQPATTTLVVKSQSGTKRFVVVGSTAATAPHATTQASPPPP